MNPPFERIPISGPSITQKEIDYVTDAATNAWYADHAMYHVRFENAFAEYVGVKHAVSLPSCTAGLHLALAALNIGPGDEVILPDLTWIASAAPISYVGATPVFADVEPDTWCLSAQSLRDCITPNTKAILPVDLYGGMGDYDAIRTIADEYDLALIEDAAEAIGSEYNHRQAGSLGDVAAFSFHGSKTLTTGEGGMLVTNDDHIHERVMILRDHGRLPGDTMFFNAEVGFKYKMSAMQAAIGLAQIERVEELIAKKRDIFQWYQNELGDTPHITLNAQPDNVKNTYWMVTALLDPALHIDRENLRTALDQCGVDTRPFFHPLSTIPAYRNTPQANAARTRNTIAYDVSPRGLNLPSGQNMTPQLVKQVTSALKVSIAKLKK